MRKFFLTPQNQGMRKAGKLRRHMLLLGQFLKRIHILLDLQTTSKNFLLATAKREILRVFSRFRWFQRTFLNFFHFFVDLRLDSLQ